MEVLSATSGSEMSVLPPQNASGNWVKIVQRIPVRIELERAAAYDLVRREIGSGRQAFVVCAAIDDQNRTQVKAAEAAGVRCDGLHVFATQPYLSIINTAVAQDCDLICMASHGRRGVSALVLGSETVKVLTHSNIPVLVYR